MRILVTHEIEVKKKWLTLDTLYDEVVILRELPYMQMKQEIIEYVKKHPEVDAIDIADDLLLDAFEVNDILIELFNEGILGEV